MKTSSLLVLGAVVVALSAVVSHADAAIIYSDLGPGDSFQDPYPIPSGLIVIGPASTYRVACSFATGRAGWKFQSAELALGYTSANGDNPFTVQIMTDVGGFPGQVLQTILSTGGPANTSTLVTVLANDSLILDANFTYWIALSANNGSSSAWMLNNTTTSVATSQFDGGTCANLTGTSGAMRINGIAVPEPTSLVIMLPFVCCFLARRAVS
jgi:hypothetical protein